MTAAAECKMVTGRGALERRGRGLANASVMAVAMIGAWHGSSAAADAELREKSPSEAAASPAADDASNKPIILAGRWTGPRYGYARIGPKGSNGGKASTLTYDIVACGDGWCGIAVTDDAPCGSIGLRIAADTTKNSPNAFTGKLELAKGTASYVIEAWYAAPDASEPGSDANARLSLIGDTGTELLMMRRSFPLQAELARIGDAQCTLEKATS